MTDEARPKTRFRIVKIILAIVVVLVISLEVGLRVLIQVQPDRFGKLKPDLEELMETAKLAKHPYLAYYGRPGWSTEPDPETGKGKQLSHNEYGFRGEAPPLEKGPNTYRIVCLGGSSTYGHDPTSDANTWPARLESFLNQYPEVHGKQIEVINGGLSGWSTFESTVNLAFRMVEWEPDLVIVYHTINDMRCALYTRGGEVTMDNMQWRDSFPRFVKSPGERLLENSMTYVVWRALFTDYVDRVETINNLGIINYDADALDMYARETPSDRGFQSFRRNLRSIGAIATEHGAKVLFASQGNDDRDIKAKSGPQQLAGMARMTTILEEVATEKGFAYVDAKTQLEAHAKKVGINQIFTGEVHLTNAGAEQLAKIMAGAILNAENELLGQ